MQSAKSLRVVLLGGGSLGRAFLRQLRESAFPIELVGIMTAYHGRRVALDGLSPEDALSALEAGELGFDASEDFAKIIDEAKPDVVVEAIPQNIRTGEPALGYHRLCLDRGIHVVTSNKAPIAIGYRDLRHRAAKAKVQFRFESTILDGLPVFSFVQQLYGQRVVKVRGILNATSSVVLETVANGSTRARGLARAQAQGIAEADPILDIDGWDAAIKSALIANVWMDGALRTIDVARLGCEGLKDNAIVKAAAEGGHYRLVSNIENKDGQISASVKPEILMPEDTLYNLQGAQGAIEIQMTSGQKFCLIQRSPGLASAAWGLIQDCVAIKDGVAQV